GLQKRRVSVWLPPGGLRYLERLARVLSLDAESSETFFTETFALAEYDPDAPLTTAVGHVSFRRTRHWVPCWALRIEGQRATLVYLADTGWDDSLLPFARDADLLIVEATLFPDAEPAAREGHLDLLQAIRLATLSHARRTLITHYWNSPATVATLSTVREQFPGTVELAYPGLTIAVSPQGGEP
ncbi:MAG: MBL fold metallo-hydrolase, partial [Thermomicrobium sp.]|nr:MBL fold metallo-hydrolase [Thermomicrobium sp.]